MPMESASTADRSNSPVGGGTEIYYLSGTGNSLSIARELQKRIPRTNLIPIVGLLGQDAVASRAEMVGFVFPIYCRLHTSRLDLIAATLDHLEAELGAPTELASLLEVRVPEGWPPGEYDRPAIESFRDRLVESGEAAGWYSWYAIWRPDDGQMGVLVGTGGYFGPPDADGTVEVGYSILPDFRARGFATEIVRALVERAFSTPAVRRVIAHTQPENVSSVRVLERSGFFLAGAGQEPGTVQYAQWRPATRPVPPADQV